MPLDYTNYVIAGEEILDEDSRTNVHTAIFRLDENSVTCCRVKQECFAEVAYFPDEEDNRATAYAKTLRMTFREGDTLHIPNNNGASVAVRVLEDKSPYKTTYLKNSANDLTFVVNGVKCLADKDYLSAISPVFKKMLKGSFAESKCAEVELKGIESADLLNDFLLAVSPQRVQVS
uniref:BTB domain-containing protein n=2 Tax=Ditylenchus dipsaci TaxID=166011 RepID=A0A915EB38_9BILA